MWPETVDRAQTCLVKVVEKTTTVTYYEAVEDRAALLDSYTYPSEVFSTEPPPFAYAGFNPTVHEQVNRDGLFQQELVSSQPNICQEVHVRSNAPTAYGCPPPAYRTPTHTEPTKASSSLYHSRGTLPHQVPTTTTSPHAPPSYSPHRTDQPHIIENKGIRFQITGMLGTGGYARVMKAILLVPTRRGVDMAIKVMHKDRVYQNPQGRMLMMEERRALERVTESGLSGLAKVFCVWDDEENIYFAMPLYRCDLWALNIQRDITYHKIVMRYVVAELILALANLHSLGIIHRDIKPANILVDAHGHLSLADFGLAYLSYSFTPVTKLKFPGTDVVGTTVYQAPELIRRSLGENVPYGSAVDVWALGLVIYETVLGSERPWFDEASDMDVKARILGGEFRWDVVERYDVELSNLLRCMLFASAPRRITAEAAKYHPYFKGVDWELLGRGVIPEFEGGPIYPVPDCTSHPSTSISFSSFHAGRDRRWRYYPGDFDRYGNMVLPDSVYKQRKLDEMHSNAHDYICPPDYLETVFPDVP